MWVGPDPARDRLAQHLAQATGHGPLLCQLLARADVDAGEVDAYLNPKLRDLMPDPSHLLDMDRAVACFLAHVRAGHRIAIFADYDVDGAASAALLHEWLGKVGLAPTLYVPDRLDEGYGPNVPAMERLAAEHKLILCVDCGTLAHGPIAAARAAGAEVIVLDHHTGGETLPEAPVVNPNRQDETSAHGMLCAAGVVFLFLAAANREQRRAGARCPDLMEMLDLVALATVADVAPLKGLNRALVRQGLTVAASRRRPGLAALADVASLSTAPTPYHLGFVLGPRINAGGRVGRADLGARLLTADRASAPGLAAELDQLNTARRAIEASVREEAIAQAEARGTDGPLVWAAGADWHPGVVGIVAARLKEAFNRPAVVIGFQGSVGAGSARSVTGIDLGAAIAACVAEGALPKGGGHKMAAGLTVTRDGLEAAMARLGAHLARQGAQHRGAADLTLEGVLAAGGATVDLIETLERAGPFGAGAPQPRFAMPDMRVASARVVGAGHLQLRLKDATGSLDAIAFDAAQGPLAALAAGDGHAWHIAGRLECDDWGGRRRAKLRIEDAAPA
ncbi:MAG: single-stranded-DNA-specific exonuclease RecJ [Pseudomonadota bacterium]